MFQAQPLAEPVPDVLIHRPVGLAYLPQLEVVHPPRQPEMQILHHFLWCQKQPASAHLFVQGPAELLPRLRRRPQVGTGRSRNCRPKPPDCLTANTKPPPRPPPAP